MAQLGLGAAKAANTATLVSVVGVVEQAKRIRSYGPRAGTEAPKSDGQKPKSTCRQSVSRRQYDIDLLYH
jgi:hypothetical protein